MTEEEYLNIPKPVKEEIINKTIVDGYWDAKYKLITIIPLVKNPVRRTLILTQRELDQFLEGYNEYGEFIVELRRIVEE